jgi:hypothetical protein
VTRELGPNANNCVAKWNPKLDEAEFDEIVRGDRLTIASFHSGAIHSIEKLWEHMTDELLADGLGKCADALEVALHHRFLEHFMPNVADVAGATTEPFADLEVKSKLKNGGRPTELEDENGHGESGRR